MRGGGRAFAESKVVDVSITKFEIQNLSHKTQTEFFHSDTFYIAMDWDAGSSGHDIHEGDYFDVTLPDNMKFPSGTTASDFDLADSDGNVIAKAHVTPGTGDAGGTVHVVFTKAVENKYNVKGTMYLAARFNESKITVDQENKFSITVNGNVAGHTSTKETGVVVTGSKPIKDESLIKWGQSVPDDKQQAQWVARVNHVKGNLTNAKVTDTLGSSGMTYIPSSFRLYRVVFDAYGEVSQELEAKTGDELVASGKLVFAPDNASFTLDLGTTNEQYYLRYKSTYTPGTKLLNHLRLESGSKAWVSDASYQSANSGGSAGGDLASKIKLTKVDADDNVTPLKNAVFTVTRPNGSTFELTTGADGTVTSEKLEQGTYKVKEKTPPAGYELNDEEYTLEVTSTGGALKTITDKPIKITVNVNKKWVGPVGSSVTVRLLADGNDTGKTVVLDAAGGWTGTFTDLRKCKPDGTEIKYTVTEAQVSGVDAGKYSTAVSGDAAAGFTITNKNTETVKIPVTKKWIGPKGSEVTVKLLADGVEAPGQELKLNEGNGWKGEFSNLPKYKADGSEIAYMVTEAQVSGIDASKYATNISGSTASGYIITNKNIETVKVSVEKKWVGPKGTEVTVKLLADGAEVPGQELKLNEGNGWKGDFSDLPKYKDDGAEIKYTVTEAQVSGVEAGKYTTVVAGDAASGYTITNTNGEAVKVPVEKKWIGPKGSEVTVKLLADGTEVPGQELKLNEGNGWKGDFSDLPKYKADGSEIVYTVTEAQVAGVDTDKYSTAVEGSAANGYTITNTNTETVKVPVSKKWVGPKGSEVVVKLLADGTDAGKELTLREDNGWSGLFEDLPKYKADGSEIVYTVTEAQVSGVDAGKYSTAVSGDAAAGFTITNTNTEKVDVFGAKTWDDDNNRDGDRPTSITVNLMRDGIKADSAVVMADVAGNWDYSFTGLAKYDPADGHEYKYTVTEEAVANYATEINGTAIKNSHTPGKTSLTVTKAWSDVNNQDGIRPSSIKVQLYANDAALDAPVELNEGNSWTYTWTGLFQKENGKDIVYSVKEVDVPRGYEVSIAGDATTGFTLTNAHVPETVSIPVVKKWVGGEGTPVTIHLLANGVDTGKKLVLGKDEGWKGSFSDLPKFAEGKEIVYTVTEDAVEGYTSEVSGDAASGFTVTNTVVPPETPKVVSVMPRTGDSAGGVAAAVAAIAGFAALGGAAAYRRREE